MVFMCSWVLVYSYRCGCSLNVSHGVGTTRYEMYPGVLISQGYLLFGMCGFVTSLGVN